MNSKRFGLVQRFKLILGTFLLATASGPSFAEQFIYAPATFFGFSGWTAGWMSNMPRGTLNQDWYPGSTTASQVTNYAITDTHDTTFLASTSAQRVAPSMTTSLSPDPALQDFQIINGLSPTNVSAAMAIAENQYIEFPFTTGTMYYADTTASAAKFYINLITTAQRWNQNGNSNPRAFGYAAYIVDGSGNHVGGEIASLADVRTSLGTSFEFVRNQDGPGPGLTLQPGTAYTLRFYLHRASGNTDGRASWDDTLFTMSREALAEIVVSASTVSATPTPAGTENNYNYTFDVYNNGPDPTTAIISDGLPTTVPPGTVTWTCTLQNPAGACNASSGAGVINNPNQALLSGQTAVYSVSWTGPGVTTPDTHTISALPTTTSPTDPITTNNTATVSLAPPTITASNDSLTLSTSTSTGATTVTTNDSGVGGTVDPNSVTVALQPPAGSVACVAGVCTYTPPAGGLLAPVDYQYSVCLTPPNGTICTTATVTVTPPPTIVATDDAVTLPTNTSPGVTPVTTNDTGIMGTIDPNSVKVATPPTVGTVACAAGVCTYTPPTGGLTAPVTYQYEVCLEAPSASVCTTATVTVTPPPTIVATDDAVTLLTNTSPGVTTVTTNDTGIMGTVDPNSVTVATPPPVGTVACATGVCTYTPPASGLTSPVTYQYNVCLAAPNESVCTTATVTVSPPSHAPVPVLGWLGLGSLASLLGVFGMARVRRRTGG
ncbi:hypothetical protein [Ottowia thiooxydans]|uniref:hypothetical protein n=1 Tax=Ottowia thiooxydans TaxID=219182 RepID=UPI000402EB3F|nr:hypothetical protein [Ottowia thiooxydans]